MSKPKDMPLIPTNTGNLGCMVLLRSIGHDPETKVFVWQDQVHDGFWLTAPGHQYGHLTPAPESQQPQQRFRPGGKPWEIPLPNGKRARTLYLINPNEELYEPIGRGPSPLEAHVTTKSLKIVITSCPLLIRCVYVGNGQRDLDEYTTKKGTWYPSTQTMTALGHLRERDVYLWRDNVAGGIWQTKTGERYGWLKHWEGQAAHEPWMVVDNRAWAMIAGPDDMITILWLLDPDTEVVKDMGLGSGVVFRRPSGRVVGSALHAMIRLVDHMSMAKEDMKYFEPLSEEPFQERGGRDKQMSWDSDTEDEDAGWEWVSG